MVRVGVSWAGLGKARDTIVGSERVRGVSGGERKRVSIGIVSHPLPRCYVLLLYPNISDHWPVSLQELISNPMILFLDEPTSGE